MTDSLNHGSSHHKSGSDQQQTGTPPRLDLCKNPCIKALLLVLICACSCFISLPNVHANPATNGDAYLAADAPKDGSKPNRERTTVKLSLRYTTPVVSKTSGYTVKVAITNTSNQASGPGSLNIATNALYTFSSRIDMQDWAEGGSRIPTPNNLISQHVDSIEPGQSIEVTATVPPDQEKLMAMNTWGPKPILISYTSDKPTESGKPLHGAISTFLTRSTEGLTTAQTPPMSISMLLPLASTGWGLDQDKSKLLMTGQTASQQGNKAERKDPSATPSATKSKENTDCSPGQCSENTKQKNGMSGAEPKQNTQVSSVVHIDQEAIKQQERQIQLLQHHPKLNTLADPLYLHYFSNVVRIDAGMQPAVFDMSSYNDQTAKQYNAAGIENDDWNALAARSELQAALGNTKGTKPIYAFQGRSNWSLDSLEQARKQGYTAAIAPRGLDAESGNSVHTSKYSVPTDSGEMTVLSAQRELSALAQGEPTSVKAAGEQTTAGQIARFMAQSAFFQMEQPYTERIILVCFSSNQDTTTANQLMDSVEAAPWLSLNPLDAIAEAQPYFKGQQAREIISQEQDGVANKTAATSLDGTLESLAASRADIERFATSVRAKPEQTRSSPSASTGKSDAQALARQDATDTARRSDDPSQWLKEVMQAHDALALHALASTENAGGMADAARDLTNQLLNGIEIKPSESITVVSETAKMPVTLSNTHPYPVAVRVSSKTDSMEIVTTRTATTVIPANSEAQVVFTVRVATAGQADAEISLVDHNGIPFGQTHSTHINSNLRLSDMSGLVIVALALILGALGIWRQINRKKDPNE